MRFAIRDLFMAVTTTGRESSWQSPLQLWIIGTRGIAPTNVRSLRPNLAAGVVIINH